MFLETFAIFQEGKGRVAAKSNSIVEVWYTPQDDHSHVYKHDEPRPVAVDRTSLIQEIDCCLYTIQDNDRPPKCFEEDDIAYANDQDLELNDHRS
jgi:hypothetical protein